MNPVCSVNEDGAVQRFPYVDRVVSSCLLAAGFLDVVPTVIYDVAQAFLLPLSLRDR